jgi:hypothetical protein
MGRPKINEISSEKLQLTLHGAPLVATPPLSAGAIEARALIEKARQLKEQQMQATLGEQLRAKLDEAAKKESLKSTLNEWDADEQKQIKGEVMETTKKHLFGVSNNASRTTFNYVRDNPGLRIGELIKKLAAQGFKDTTISSLAYQMVTAGMLRKDDNTGGFHAIVPEFIPYNINKIRRERLLKQQKEMAVLNEKVPAKKVVLIKRKENGSGFESLTPKEEARHDANTAGIGALTVNTDQPMRVAMPWKPEQVVDQLTLVQAKAVHAYLQQVFGAL